jgi:hypothetical protein
VGWKVTSKENQIQELEFEAIVRQNHQLEVEIPNPTDKKHCKIMANITTPANKDWKGYFQGEEFLEIQAGQASGKYKITYCPLTMTSSEQVPEIKQ